MIRHAVNSIAQFHEDDSGQGLVEYVLIIALIGFSAVAGMSTIASSINRTFALVGTKVSNYIS